MEENSGINKGGIFSSFANVFQKYSMYFFLIILMVLFQVLSNGILFQPLNITNIILQNSYILILAIGMVFLIILGDVDLSVGSTAAFTGALSAIFTIRMGMSTPLAIILCLIVGGLIGAFIGFWVAYVNVPSFIATLAGMLIFRGLTIVILDGRSLAPFPDSFRLMGSGFLTDFLNGDGLHLTTLIIGIIIAVAVLVFAIYKRNRAKKLGFKTEAFGKYISKQLVMIVFLLALTYILAMYEGYPNVLIILGILILGYSFLANQTTIGRHIYATGGNEQAASLSGIKTKFTRFIMFVNMGVLSAVAGLVFASRLNAATAAAGNGFELDAIAACYIGGASAYGGVGTVFGAIIGGLVMGVLNNGMSLLGIGVDWQQAIKGLVLLFAVAWDIYNKNKVD